MNNEGRVFKTIEGKIVVGKHPYFIFISGIDGCGKTEFARELALYLKSKDFSVQVIHLDDFHNPKSIRYSSETSQIENYLYRSFNFDKLKSEVLDEIKRSNKLDAEYQLLDLKTDENSKSVRYQVEPNSVVILEGVFLARRDLLPYKDYFVLLQASWQTCFERASLRDLTNFGEDVSEKFYSKYYPAQVQYAREFLPEEQADLIVSNENYESRFIKEKDGQNLLKSLNQIKTICFDLWNTLVPLDPSVKRESTLKIARALNLEIVEFDRLWKEHRNLRETMDLEKFVKWFIARNEIKVPNSVISEIIDIRKTLFGDALQKPFKDAILTLNILKSAGFKLGLISNCTSDVVESAKKIEMFDLFDAKIFSCSVGLMKPHEAIYRRASEELGTDPSSILFVGDGNDSELTGAKNIGMQTLLFDPQEKNDWQGLKCISLETLIQII